MNTLKENIIEKERIQKILVANTGSIYEMYKDIIYRTIYEKSFNSYLADIITTATSRGLK